MQHKMLRFNVNAQPLLLCAFLILWGAGLCTGSAFKSVAFAMARWVGNLKKKRYIASMFGE